MHTVKKNGCFNNQSPVVQNCVSLTLSLHVTPQFVNCISTSKANTLLFFVKKNVRILCIAKDSHIFTLLFFV